MAERIEIVRPGHSGNMGIKTLAVAATPTTSWMITAIFSSAVVCFVARM